MKWPWTTCRGHSSAMLYYSLSYTTSTISLPPFLSPSQRDLVELFAFSVFEALNPASRSSGDLALLTYPSSIYPLD